MIASHTTEPAPAALGRLPTLDRFLLVWIGAAMVIGLLAGRSIPGLGAALDTVAIDGISLPIALGLLVMMYPVLVLWWRCDGLRSCTRRGYTETPSPETCWRSWYRGPVTTRSAGSCEGWRTGRACPCSPACGVVTGATRAAWPLPPWVHE